MHIFSHILKSVILGVGFNWWHQKVDEICHSEGLDNPANICIWIFSKLGVKEEKGDKVITYMQKKKQPFTLTSISDKINNKKFYLVKPETS